MAFKLLAGGSFTQIGGQAISLLASYDGSAWSAIGTGLPLTIVWSVVQLPNGEIFAGGNDGATGVIARHSGGAWSSTLTGSASCCHVALAPNGTLCCINGTGVYRWDSPNWTPIGPSIVNAFLRIHADADSNFYVAGSFTVFPGAGQYFIKWDGSTWSTPDTPGFNGACIAMGSGGGNVYVGGVFTVPAARIAQFDGAAWSAMSTGLNAESYSIGVDSAGVVYAGGTHTNKLARWDGASWAAVGSGITGTNVIALAAGAAREMYVGGGFTTAGAVTATNIAKWSDDLGAWTALGDANSDVYALYYVDIAAAPTNLTYSTNPAVYEIDIEITPNTPSNDGGVITSYTTGTLPTGLSLDGGTGVISGTPTAVTSNTYTITGTNSGGSTTEDVDITVSIFWDVSYDSVGGTSVSPERVISGGHVTEPTPPTRSGYTFVGWYWEAEYVTMFNFVTDVITADTTLFAKWQVDEIFWDFTFVSNGGSAVTPQSVANATHATEPTPPTKPGYTFVAWYKDIGLSMLWDFDVDVVTADTSVYARWAFGTSTVTFDSQGGSAVASKTVLTGIIITPPTAPTRAGYSFIDWYTEAGCVTVWNFTTDAVVAPMTLYAKWVGASGYVAFDSQGGSSVLGQVSTIGELVTEPTAPTKANNTFVGWYKDVACTHVWTFATDLMTKNMTLYAKWVGASGYVAFDSQGGSSVLGQVSTIGELVTEPTAPTKANNTFVGWYKDVACTHVWTFATDLMTKNMTLYAKWLTATYTVTFDTQGGSAIASQSIVGGALVRKTLTPSKANCTFYAWYKEAACTNLWSYPLDTISAATTLYAKWIALSSITDKFYVCGLYNTQGYSVYELLNGNVVKMGFGIFGSAYGMAKAANGDLYVCGYLNNTDEHDRKKCCVYRWDGAAWSMVGGEFNQCVTKIVCTSNGDIYVGGDFGVVGSNAVYVGGAAGNVLCNHVARWDGTSWGSLSTGLSGVTKLCLFDDVVYAAGWVAINYSTLVYLVVRWNGYAWIAVSNPYPIYLQPHDLAVSALNIACVTTIGWLYGLSSGILTLLSDVRANVIISTPNGDTLVFNNYFNLAQPVYAWDGTALVHIASSCAPAIRCRDFGTGAVFIITSDGNLFSLTENTVARLMPQSIHYNAILDVCYAAPSNAPVDPDEPGYHYAYGTISFSVIETSPDDPIDPDEPGYHYTYKTITFTVNAIVDPPEELGYTYKTITFDVVESGTKIEGATGLIEFDVFDGSSSTETNLAMIEFNVSGPVEVLHTVTFYVNTSFSAVGVPMTLHTTSGGALTAGNKTVMVKIYQTGKLIASASSFIRVGAGDGIWAEIKGIPNPYGGTIRVDGYVKNKLEYSETIAYTQNIGVQLV